MEKDIVQKPENKVKVWFKRHSESSNTNCFSSEHQGNTAEILGAKMLKILVEPQKKARVTEDCCFTAAIAPEVTTFVVHEKQLSLGKTP